MLQGSMPALITPFKNGAVDLEGLKALVAWHIAEGSHGLVPVGTTGDDEPALRVAPQFSASRDRQFFRRIAAA